MRARSASFLCKYHLHDSRAFRILFEPARDDTRSPDAGLSDPLLAVAVGDSGELSTMHACRAMFRFLEAYFERGTGSDEIAMLLSGLAIDEDGRPTDPAAWDDWLTAIDDARGGHDAASG